MKLPNTLSGTQKDLNRCFFDFFFFCSWRSYMWPLRPLEKTVSLLIGRFHSKDAQDSPLMCENKILEILNSI